jgi:hypothetical protein
MANKQFIRFRLTGDKRPISFQIPIKGMMLKRPNKDGEPNATGSLKKIHYIPGVDSIFIEDYDGDEKGKKIYFEEGFLDVHKDNRPLLTILKQHTWFNNHYEMVDEDATAEKELTNYELIEKAIAKVNISNEEELKANGLILLGPAVIEMSETRVRAALKKRAFETPKELLEEMSTSDYRAKYAGALAVLRGTLLINPTRTAVTWPNGKVVVSVAAGVDPIEKLGSFLSGNDDAAMITLQEIGERSKRAYNIKVPVDLEGEINEVIAQKKASNGVSLASDGVGLEEASVMFKERFEKEVPNNKKNDLEWIMSKLEE